MVAPRHAESSQRRLEADPYCARVVDAQHRLLLEVTLVELPQRLDPEVALLAAVLRIEQHEDEAGLLHDLPVGLAELPLPRQQREAVREAGRDRAVEKLLELVGAHLWEVGAL